MKQFEINGKNEGQRLDKFLSRILRNAGTPFIYKMLRKKNITLNDKKADGNVILKAGDTVKLYFSDESYEKLSGDGEAESRVNGKSWNNGENGSNAEDGKNRPVDPDLTCYKGIKPRKSFASSIIYEDSNIILINKPSGILSQKAKNDDISMNEYIGYYLLHENKMSPEDFKQYRPSVVNRLDRNTSGIIIAAKNLRAAAVISDGLKDRTINKYYKCVVEGRFEKEGLHTGYLKKDRSRNIVTVSDEKMEGADYIETEYELLETDGTNSLLSVHLLTGRSHQIRAHLAHLGHSIINDHKYGHPKTGNTKSCTNDSNTPARPREQGQLLHAYKITFPLYADELFSSISGKTFVCDADFKL